MILRPYQDEAVQSALDVFDAKQSALIVLPTGCGKTVVAANIAKHYMDLGKILWIAHREELIFQGQDTLERVTGQNADIEMADAWATAGLFGSKIVVSTIQTQISGTNGGRMTRFNPDEFSLVVVDECHHAPSDSYRTMLEHYKQNSNVKILGLSATPDRLDEKALGQIFNDVAFDYGILDAINDGWLVPVKELPVSILDLDYSTVGSVAGELNGKDLARVLEEDKILYGMATPILDLCGDDKTLIFTASVVQAERMCSILNNEKPGSAEHVSAGTPKEVRRDLFARYKSRDFQYLANVGIATEGWDEPDVRYIAMARATKSRMLYAQVMGRMMRCLPGVVDGENLDTPEKRRAAIAASDKTECTILDFAGNAGKHKLVHPADVLGGTYSDEVVTRATENIERDGKPADLASELEKAERELARRHRLRQETEARKHIKGKSLYKVGSTDPFDVLDLVPCREPGWHKGRKPSDRQRAALEKFGINVHEDMSFTHASQLLDKLITRSKAGLPTYKQTKLLQGKGFGDELSQLTFRQASAIIDQIAKAKWITPKPAHRALMIHNARNSQ